jgi:Tol biopolymer transport system component
VEKVKWRGGLTPGTRGKRTNRTVVSGDGVRSESIQAGTEESSFSSATRFQCGGFRASHAAILNRSEFSAVWSPDGGTIVFDSNRKGPSDLYRKKPNGAGSEELLYADSLLKYPTNWSTDGKFLLYLVANDPKTGFDLWVLPNPLGPPGGSKPYPFLHTQFAESNGQFSPDGRWVAYNSSESCRPEIYATPFPGPGGTRQISTGGGQYPPGSPNRYIGGGRYFA